MIWMVMEIFVSSNDDLSNSKSLEMIKFYCTYMLPYFRLQGFILLSAIYVHVGEKRYLKITSKEFTHAGQLVTEELQCIGLENLFAKNKMDQVIQVSRVGFRFEFSRDRRAY